MSNVKFWWPEWIGDPSYEFHDKYVLMKDGNDGIMRKIFYRTYSEYSSQYDPELLNREIVPKEQRIPFSRHSSFDKSKRKNEQNP